MAGVKQGSASAKIRAIAKILIGGTLSRQYSLRRQRSIPAEYRVRDKVLDQNGAIPLVWWTHAPNFGDVLSPWLVRRMTGRTVEYAEQGRKHYVAVGSVASKATADSVVWGAGAFGSEKKPLAARAQYRAVRGPLTRARLGYAGATVPPVYGDPALLTPLYFHPKVRRTHEVGLVLRWSEKKWLGASLEPGVKLIDLGRDDVEGVLEDFLSCKRIATSSLHGLIIADAYGIPSAWIASSSPMGGTFKYYDYFLSVNKVRHPQELEVDEQPVSVSLLTSRLEYDSRAIEFNYRKLLSACPFMTRAR
jgi:pyruvyltransferase